MHKTMTETMTATIEQVRNKRKIRNPNRYKDDGTYDNKPLDPNYFKIYYHTKGTEQI